MNILKASLFFTLFIFISCSSSDKNMNRINVSLIQNNRAKNFVIYPVKSKKIESNYNIFKNSLIIYKEFIDNYSTSVVPFWKIDKTHNIKDVLVNKKISLKNVLFIKTFINSEKKNTVIKYTIEMNLEDYNGKEIIHLVDEFKFDQIKIDKEKLSLDSTYYITKSLRKLSKFLMRFMKRFKYMEKIEENRKINPAYVVNYKFYNNKMVEVDKDQVIQLIKLIYKDITKEKIDQLIENNSDLFYNFQKK